MPLYVQEFADSPSRDSKKRNRSGSPPSSRHEERYHYDDSPKRKRAKRYGTLGLQYKL